MHPSSSSRQWLCGNMPAMDGQWWSSRIVSVRTNRVLNKSKARSINILIKIEIIYIYIYINRNIYIYYLYSYRYIDIYYFIYTLLYMKTVVRHQTLFDWERFFNCRKLENLKKYATVLSKNFKEIQSKLKLF